MGMGDGGGLHPDGKHWEKCGGGFLPERDRSLENNTVKSCQHPQQVPVE